jgi:phospholipase D1/2
LVFKQFLLRLATNASARQKPGYLFPAQGLARGLCAVYAVIVDRLKTASAASSRRAVLIKILLLFLLLFSVPLAWRWTPLNEWINFETIIGWQLSVKNDPAAIYFVIGGYLLGSLVLFPVTILNVATVFTFGPILGNLYAFAAWLASAAMGYGIGRALGHQMVEKLAHSWLDRLIQPAERHGFVTVLTMRVLPVAPFTLVNFFVGASGIRFRDFFLASVVGRIPGIVMLTLAGIQMEHFLRRPAAMSVVLLGLILILTPLATGWLFKRLASGDRRQ